MDRFKASLMYIGIITVITIVIWVSVSVYASYSKTTIDPEMQQIIKPINPSLDYQVMQNYSASRIRPPEEFQIIATIKEGNQINQVVLNPYNIAPSPLPIVSSSSAVIEEFISPPVASPSGEI